MSASPDECAGHVLEVVPTIMHAIRAEMRGHRAPELSVAQFRMLTFLSRHEGASLSDVADHMGLTLPSMSKMMDGLVTRGLVARQEDPHDRRRVTLALTAEGRKTFDRSRKATQACMSGWLSALSEPERETVISAMEALRPIFAGSRGGRGEPDEWAPRC